MPLSNPAVASCALLTCLVGLVGCANSVSGEASRASDGHRTLSPNCRLAAPLGRFQPAVDLLIANFDNKPDTDDLLAIAGLATMLDDPRFACVRFIATTGAYGNKNPGDFIKADSLLALAFGKHWTDADADRAGAEDFLAKQALATLRAGGDVWIMEAGQSDLTASVAKRVFTADPSLDLRSRVHVVQHSGVNEYLTTPSALSYVKSHLDYIKIADGNVVGNGTPGFKTKSGAAWSALVADPESGSVWAEAQRLAVSLNPDTAYPNDAIAAGGLDFSDLAEAAYIFGFEHLVDVHAFVAEFASQRQLPPS